MYIVVIKQCLQIFVRLMAGFHSYTHARMRLIPSVDHLKKTSEEVK